MASQAFSALTNVLKGDPTTLTAGPLKLMERPRGYKARPPVEAGTAIALVADYEMKAAFARAPYL